MSSLLGTMDIAKQALHLNQTQIGVTGNNIANVDTPGYSRRKVMVEETFPLNTAPGQIGTGVNATEVVRIFDEFIETQYLDKLSEQERWGTLHTHLTDVEGLFNENQAGRLNDALAQFFKDWQDLSLWPNDANVRSALLGNSQTLINTIGILAEDLDGLASRIDEVIADDVDEVNHLLEQIAGLNKKIQTSQKPGVQANVSLDERDLKIRELAGKLDIHCIDKGGGNLTITTGSGQTLVDGEACFTLDFKGPQITTILTEGSTFDTDGQVYFSGSSSYEYTIEVVNDGDVDGSPPAMFRVSLDGGQTWLTNEDGTTKTFEARSHGNRIRLPQGELELWFGTNSDMTGVPANALATGDSFVLVPKNGVYWHAGDSLTENITSQIAVNGQASTSRITGGSIGGNLAFRDNAVGRYQERLRALVKGLVWEVNAIHSQGHGLTPLVRATGTFEVTSQTTALGTPGSGLAFAEKLQPGNLSVSVHNNTTGENVVSVLDFDPSSTATDNFDPAVHSLEDIRDAFNAIDGLSAVINDNKLQLQADSGYSFSFGSDSSGLLAGLGINTYFQGENASSLALNPAVKTHLDHLNAGQMNALGFMDPGSNVTAQDIAALQYTGISFATFSSSTSNQTLQDYYTALVTTIGADTARSKFNFTYQQSLAHDLEIRQDSVSAVNLDEEMSNLIKFQQSYSAAAKLITTANQMLDTLLGMKQ
ncbi:MAG: flagellar hook-associated protein FlgK [Deltaproteobacteria bacterium]|nr:MAG: flagellar hook-associated protein FlgK [Deltaproteobacteria bacterium]